MKVVSPAGVEIEVLTNMFIIVEKLLKTQILMWLPTC